MSVIGTHEIVEEVISKLPFAPNLLPKGLGFLVGTAPKGKLQVATLVAALPVWSTLAPNVRVIYPHDPEDAPHALLLNVIVIAPQSGGKGFTRRIVKYVLGKLYEHDQLLRQAETKNKEERKAAAKNKKAPKEIITDVRTMPAKSSQAMITKRADNFYRLYGRPLTLFIFSEELGAITESNKQAFSNLNVIMRFAYDLGSIGEGQDYMSDASYSAQPDIIISSLFCATPSALFEYMGKRQIEHGNVTRNIYCDLNVQLGDSAPKYKKIEPEQQEVIDAIVERMNADTYATPQELAPLIDIDMAWLFPTVIRWCHAQTDQAVKDGDEARGTFFKRSSVSAFRGATLCFYLYHIDNDLAKTESDKISEDAIRNRVRKIYLFLANYILKGMMDKFGTTYNDLSRKIEKATKTQPSLYNSMPGRFTRDQLKEKVQELGLTTPFRTFIYKWKERKWIAEVEPGVYQKL